MLVGLGQAYELTFKPADGSRRKTVRFPPSYWWAWQSGHSTGDIVLAKVLGRSSTNVREGQAIDVHREFHGNDPTKTLRVEVGAMRRPVTHIGRVIAFAYDARGFSSTKSDLPYEHYFGAMTHGEQPPFPESAWPDLVVDADNTVAIVRRSGNTFRLADWVIG